MNKLMSVIGFSLLTAIFVRADDFRTFTDTQGRAVEARIIEYDATKGRLQIERLDGKRSWVPPGVFAEADREYIKEWIAADLVLSEETLRISFKKKSESINRKAVNGSDGFDGEAVHFEITLENRSKQPVGNLEIEYCYYITVDVKDREERPRRVTRSATMPRIDASSSAVFTTDDVTYGEILRYIPVYIDKRQRGYDEKSISREDLEGIWLRIKGPSVGGVPSIRDACYPSDLKNNAVWAEEHSAYLEKFQERGLAIDQREHYTWMRDVCVEISDENDKAKLHEISEGISIFYDDQMDSFGFGAQIVAVSFYYKQMYDLALLWADKGVRNSDSSATRFPHMLLAELYASAPQPELHDGAQALEHALILNKKSPEETAYNTDLLARAHARNGQFDLAVKMEEKAISLLLPHQRDRFAPLFESRLALYRDGCPLTLDGKEPREWYWKILRDNVHLDPDGVGVDERENFLHWRLLRWQSLPEAK